MVVISRVRLIKACRRVYVQLSSIKEVGFIELAGIKGCESAKYGSSQSKGSGYQVACTSMSQKEISDQDSRLVYVNDPFKINESLEFAS